MSCPHSDLVMVNTTKLASGEALVTTRCRLCAREWTAVRDRDDDDG